MIGSENITLSIVFIVLSLAFLIYTVYQVKRNKLLLRYSLTWILLSVLLLIIAIFPQPIFALGRRAPSASSSSSKPRPRNGWRFSRNGST